MLYMTRDNKYVVLSVMGPHAGETSGKIFDRKIRDIYKIGKTFWVVHSPSAKPDNVQRLCLKASQHNYIVDCILLAPSSANGAEDTKTTKKAKEYSIDGLEWESLPYSEDLSKVTGKITNSTCALIIDEFAFRKFDIDLWEYANFVNTRKPIIFRRGESTVCGIKKDTSTYPDKMKSRLRSVIAVGRLAKPYAVWLR